MTKQDGLWEDGPPRWGAGCAFLDYDRDGHLDLFVSNYIRLHLQHAPVPGQNSTCNWKGIPVNCSPADCRLARPLPRQRGWYVHERDQAGGALPLPAKAMSRIPAMLFDVWDRSSVCAPLFENIFHRTLDNRKSSGSGLRDAYSPAHTSIGKLPYWPGSL